MHHTNYQNDERVSTPSVRCISNNLMNSIQYAEEDARSAQAVLQAAAEAAAEAERQAALEAAAAEESQAAANDVSYLTTKSKGILRNTIATTSTIPQKRKLAKPKMTAKEKRERSVRISYVMYLFLSWVSLGLIL